MQKHFFPVVLGTARADRKSAPVADFVVSELLRLGHKSELVDVADFDLPATRSGRGTQTIDEFRSTIDSADGVVVVAPEYNHAYPGELKLLLDEGGSEFARKPLGIVGVSAGGFGGSRLIEGLRTVAIALGMVAIPHAVHISRVSSGIEEGGAYSDEKASVAIDRMVKEMAWFADVLTPARKASA